MMTPISGPSWLTDLLRGQPGPPGPAGPGGFLIYTGAIVTTAVSCAAGSATFFNTFGLGANLALRTPDVSTDGTTFLLGDGGNVADTNPASLADTNGYVIENPIDGLMYTQLNWGPGSGGGVTNPNLPAGSKYAWMRLTVMTVSGSLTYWKNVL